MSVCGLEALSLAARPHPVLTRAQPQAALRSAWVRVPALGLESLARSGPQPHCICWASDRSSAGPLPLHPGQWLVSGPCPISAASGGSYRNPVRTVAAVPGCLHPCWPPSLSVVFSCPRLTQTAWFSDNLHTACWLTCFTLPQTPRRALGPL